MRQNENLEHFDYTHALDSLKKLLREEAGPLVLEFRKNKPMRVRTKETYADILTEADTLSEEIIRGYLQKAYPTHAIFGEEGTDNGGSNSRFEWFIDPIDGTIPYVSGGENFGICVGLLENGTPVLGIIFYPAKNKMLHAIQGRGAFLNGERIKNTKQRVDINNAVVALAAPAGPGSSDYIDRYVKPVSERVRSLVFSGSYSADTLQFVEGALDAVVLANATPFDVVATMAIASEAGYEVCGLEKGAIDFHKKKVPVMYSSTKELEKKLLKFLEPASA